MRGIAWPRTSARLRSPRNVDNLKQDLWARASHTKDELVESTKDAATSVTQRAIEEVKNRAIANPAAALAIGAGLAWRIFQRPRSHRCWWGSGW